MAYRLIPLALLVALVTAPATATNAITGKPRIIDGDTPQGACTVLKMARRAILPPPFGAGVVR